MTTRLSVNINKAALLRNSRGTDSPNLMQVAEWALEAGADGLTVHPRADERHITRKDAIELANTFGKKTEINFEGDIREDFLELVLAMKPHQCTLVPVSYGEVTSHRGWDFQKWGFLLTTVIQRLKSEGIRTSVFVSPEPGSAKAAKDCGADRIEIYTEPYAIAHQQAQMDVLHRITALGKEAKDCGVGLNAGHDLTVENLPELRRALPHLEEVSIGHHLFCRALEVGFRQSVQDFLKICRDKL